MNLNHSPELDKAVRSIRCKPSRSARVSYRCIRYCTVMRWLDIFGYDGVGRSVFTPVELRQPRTELGPPASLAKISLAT